jgi:hypothetical protein
MIHDQADVGCLKWTPKRMFLPLAQMTHNTVVCEGWPSLAIPTKGLTSTLTLGASAEDGVGSKGLITNSSDWGGGGGGVWEYALNNLE